MNNKLVSGHTFYSDSTHLKVNANKKHFQKMLVKLSRQAYMNELGQAVEEGRITHGKNLCRLKEALERNFTNAKELHGYR